MAEITNVCIGIQARSTSTRFPRKAFELIGGRTMMDHVIDACDSAAHYMNRYTYKTKIFVHVALLIPFKDEIGPAFCHRDVVIVDGPEDDVLTRYMKLHKKLETDYIVRVTGDCPLIPDFLITKAITIATKNQFDYCSNVDENIRTSIDGFDVEVISKRALEWINENATEPKDREHVTIRIRREPIPPEFRIGHMVGQVDLSNIKLSVDCQEDLDRVRAHYDRIRGVITKAESLHGRHCVHRF